MPNYRITPSAGLNARRPAAPLVQPPPQDEDTRRAETRAERMSGLEQRITRSTGGQQFLDRVRRL